MAETLMVKPAEALTQPKYVRVSLGAQAWKFFRQLVQTRGAGFGLGILVLLVVMAVFAPWLAPYDPTEVDVSAILDGPSRVHLFGTDELGRDTLSRIIWGARVSLWVGIISVGLSLVLGVSAGLLAGFLGGWVDDGVMRVVDAMWAFPTIILALALGAALTPGLVTSSLAVGIVFTPVLTRLVRAQTLAVREFEYVTAARAVGVNNLRLMRLHILPNVSGPIIVQCSVLVASAIIVEAALSFLGVGIQPPTPAWGSMLRSGYQYLLNTPWSSFFPGAAIFLTVLGFNLLGDGLQRALDPQLYRA